MSADTITVEGLTNLVKEIEEAAHNIRVIRLLAIEGDISPEDAAAQVDEIRDEINTAFDA